MLNFLLSLFRNPKAIFIHSLLAKWYILVMAPAIVIIYYVFKGLENTKHGNMLVKIEEFVSHQLELCVRLAKECTPKIVEIQEWIECLGTIQ